MSIETRPPGPAAATTTPSHGRQIRAKAFQPVALRVRPRPGAARRRSSRSDHDLGPVHADPHSCIEAKSILAMYSAGEANPSGTSETPTNRTSEGLAHGVW